MSAIKGRIYKLLESVPDEVLEELADDIEDILALIETKKANDRTRIPWEETRRRLGNGNEGGKVRYIPDPVGKTGFAEGREPFNVALYVLQDEVASGVKCCWS